MLNLIQVDNKAINLKDKTRIYSQLKIKIVAMLPSKIII